MSIGGEGPAVEQPPKGERAASPESDGALVTGGAPHPQPRNFASSIKSWAGYAWFMSFGTVLPLIVFMASYLVHVTLVGAPVARMGNRFGIWISTFGFEPPGKDKLESRNKETTKKSFVERIRPYSPPGIIERRGRPIPLFWRAIWFLLVGWWLGAIWVLISWSVFLMPYPFMDTVRDLLDELPSVMTLAVPEHAAALHDSPPAT